MDDGLVVLLAAACSRSAIGMEALQPLRDLLPECKLIRLSFGLQNKTMISVTVDLEREGRTHASYVPIHPTAAAAAVLQNNPVVVVRQDKRSPLWDQEDLFQREGCPALSVVSMPFYWPPRAGTLWEGAPLAVPQNTAFHPTFGALTGAGMRPLSQESMRLLLDLAARTGRHVGPHISMLLSSLEAASLLPSEADAQEELGSGEEGGWEADEGMDALFGFEDADERVSEGVSALLPSLALHDAAAGRAAADAAEQAPHQQQHTAAPGASTAVAQAGAPAGGASRQASAAQPPRHHEQGWPNQMREWERQQAQNAIPSQLARQRGAAGASSQQPGRAAADTQGTSTGGSNPMGVGSPDGASEGGAERAVVAHLPEVQEIGSIFASLAFQAPGLERAFAMHHARAHEQADLLAVGLLIVILLAAAATHQQAFWPAGVAAVLLFTPYFVDMRMYQNMREGLLCAVQLLTAVFLGSLRPARAAAAGPLWTTGSRASSGPLSATGGVGAVCSAGGASNTPPLAGFGIICFVCHTCGLHFLLAAPLLLRLRTTRAVPLQGTNLAYALLRLPSLYADALGHLDTVHVLLLGILLMCAAVAGLAVARTWEVQMRQAWLERRRRRAAATVHAAAMVGPVATPTVEPLGASRAG